MSDAFDRVIFRGKLMDEKCKAFLMAMEKELGYELTVVQGNYNPGGVAASGGTHDGGGVVDLAAYDWKRKVECAGDLGGFAWMRPYIQGLWGQHVHLGIRDHGRLSSTAQRQQVDWDSRPPRDGLASHRVMDLRTNPHPGKEITFKYPVEVPPPAVPTNSVTRGRDKLVEAIHLVGAAAAEFSAVDAERKVVANQLAKLKAEHIELRAILKALPKK